MASILIPEVKSQSLSTLLDAIYAGIAPKVDRESELASLCKFLGISFEKQPRVLPKLPPIELLSERNIKTLLFNEAKIKALEDDNNNKNLPCSICEKKAIEHRIPVEEDSEPGFVYRCCLKSCQTVAQRTAKTFVSHLRSTHVASMRTV